jgi:ATP-dependent Clp protease adaptor protein ClpS
MSKEQVRTRPTVRTDLTPPKDYKVIYVNDDVTTFELVTQSLMSVFEYRQEPAEDKTKEINSNGSGIVAILPFEIAEQKGVEVLVSARNKGFPLEVRLEQE